MRVEVRLFATLASAVDSVSATTPFDVDVPDGSSVADLIDQLGLPHAEVHLVVLDGRMIHDRSTRLPADGRLGLFPPVGGG